MISIVSSYMQKVGKSLMMPIAVLPAAALLMGISYWITNTVGLEGTWLIPVATFLNGAGNALIANMGILFAVGIAYGMSKDQNGAAALSGLVGWLVVQGLLAPETVQGLMGFDSVDKVNAAFGSVNNQFIGILVGIMAGEVYNATSHIELPKALSFFSGRRLSLIMTAVGATLLSAILLLVWPIVYSGLVSFGEFIVSLGAVGAGIYGFANRILLMTGLHHALNSVFWFDVAGINDIPNYLAGSSAVVNSNLSGYTIGMYQAGFFPIMMFGLPAGALAMYHTARKEQKQRIGGILLAGAVASFFTGVTEPLEFSFMFVSFPLYVLHAFYTGLSLFIGAKMHWIAGFGFSAGFVDYFLSFKNPNAVNNIMLVVQGVGFAFLYYFSFRFLITKFNLLTPGRNPEEDNENEIEETTGNAKYETMAKNLIDIIGTDNLEVIDNCATRLRLIVKDSSNIDEKKIKHLGVAGVLKPSKTNLQIIIGPNVEFVAEEMKIQFKVNKK